MRRVVTVVLVFALLTGIAGIDTASLGAEQESDKAEAQRQKMAERVGRIPLMSVVEIRHADGRRFKALLRDRTADSVTVTMLEEGTATRGDEVVIPLAEIRRIEHLRDHTVRNLVIGVGVGVALVFLVLVGTCAIAANATPTETRGRRQEQP